MIWINRKFRWIDYVYIISALTFIVFLILTSKRDINGEVKNNDVNDVEAVRNLDVVGEYIINNSDEIKEYKSKEKLSTDNIKSIIFKGHFTSDVEKGEEIMIYLYRMHLTIFINGDKIYEYGSLDSDYAKIRPIGTQWIDFKSDGIKKSDDVEIRMEEINNENYELIYNKAFESICCGSKYQLLQRQLKDNVVKIIISLLIVISGLVFMVTGIVMKILKMPIVSGYISCGLLLISGGLCTFIDYNYITLMFNCAGAINVLDFLLQLFICEFILIYIKNYLKTKNYRRIADIFTTLWVIGVGLYCILVYCEIISAYAITYAYIPMIVIMITAEMILTLRDYRDDKQRSTKIVSWSVVVLAFSAIIEMVHYRNTGIFLITVFQLGLFIFAGVQIMLLIRDTKLKYMQVENARKIEEELVQNRISIMLSQIQPHFIFNALSAIAALCDIDAKKAKKAIVQFADYLRGNLDSLKAKRPISCNKEIEHVKIYLELEQMRFGEELDVEWNIETTAFLIPSLTVQPLVENAVKYGIGNKKGGGTVTINILDRDEEVLIEIKDNGTGFNPEEKKNDGRSHVGIENVRQRLKSQGNATLTIESIVDVGTTATIHIPRD